MKHLICAFLIILLICSNSFAEGKSNPVEKFLLGTNMQYSFCVIDARLSAELGKMPDERCSKNISVTVEKSKKDYDEAIKYINKNDKATSMLKDFYSLYIASMNVVQPEYNELKRIYYQRVANDTRKLDELAIKIKLELNLPLN